MIKKSITNLKDIFSSIKGHLKEFLNFKKDDLGIWILKILLIITALIVSFLLYKFFLALMTIILFLFIICSDRLENAINNYGNVTNFETDIYLQNIICSTSLFRILKENGSIFNVVQPNAMSEIYPDTSKYCNPQKIENLDFFRYPVKVHDENKVMDFKNLAATLNVMIAKKIQNCEIENVPFSYYNNIPSIQVLKISPDSFNPAFYAFDIMYIDTDQKYNFILKRQQLEQAKEIYQAAPVDEDF